jgi:hypothetical protein
VFGNDTTLYQKRVTKIKSFLNWVKESPHKHGALVISDTSSIRKSIDTAVNMFFDKRHFTNKYQQKETLFGMRLSLLPDLDIDSLILKTPEPAKDTLIIAANFANYFANTIINYFIISDFEFELMYFVFADNRADLIYFIPAGGTPNEYIEKKTFINNLQKRTK